MNEFGVPRKEPLHGLDNIDYDINEIILEQIRLLFKFGVIILLAEKTLWIGNKRANSKLM